MSYSIDRVCQVFGVSRQAYYKRQNSSLSEFFREQMVLDEVREIRRRQPQIGVRKLHRMLKPTVNCRKS